MRFNTATVKTQATTVNLAGGEAFAQSERLEFVSILLTSFVNAQYYRLQEEGLERLDALMAGIPDKKFLAKAALYARTKFGMRSVSHIVAANVGATVKGERWTRSFFDRIVHRPDDMLEIVAFYRAKHGKALPNALKDGFGLALARFDGYQLAKYRGDGKAVNLYDLVNLCHPRSTEALAALMKGQLAAPETWEVKLTQAGQQAENAEEKALLKREAWGDLIRSRKLGYFALLRNLRNILEQAPEALDAALGMLVDEKLIRKSLVLPFRYSTALEEVQKLSGSGARQTVLALNRALDVSCANVPNLEGKTLVVLDVSGSMIGKPAQIGSLFAAVLVKVNDADLMLFSDRAAYRMVNPADSALGIAQAIRSAAGDTNFRSIFETANRPYARAVILSDMQGWVGYVAPTDTYNRYCQRFGCRPKIYSFNLNSYGTMQFPEEGVYCLAGFSEQIFEVMKLLEQDRQALLHEIEAVEL